MNNPYNSNHNEYNPYQAPAAYEAESADMTLLDEPKRLPASAGMDWIKESWRIFKLNPWLWVLSILVYFAVVFVISLVPVLNIATNFINVFFVAGMAYIAYCLDMEEGASIGDLFIAFSQNPMGQIKLVLWPLAPIVILGIIAAIVFVPMISYLSNNNTMFVLFALLMALAVIPLIMALYLSPILVLFHEMPALDALKLSLKACLANILPMFIFGLVLSLISFVAMIPLGLGLFVTMPMGFIAMYVIYKDTLLS